MKFLLSMILFLSVAGATLASDNYSTQLTYLPVLVSPASGTTARKIAVGDFVQIGDCISAGGNAFVVQLVGAWDNTTSDTDLLEVMTLPGSDGLGGKVLHPNFGNAPYEVDLPLKEYPAVRGKLAKRDLLMIKVKQGSVVYSIGSKLSTLSSATSGVTLETDEVLVIDSGEAVWAFGMDGGQVSVIEVR